MVCVSVAACGGSQGTGTSANPNTNQNVDAGTGTGDAATDSQTSNAAVLGLLQQALTDALSNDTSTRVVAPVSYITVNSSNACQQGGTYTTTGDWDNDEANSSYTYQFDTTFNNCDGLNGTVTYSGGGQISGQDYMSTYTINGSIGGNGCVLAYNNFGYEISQISSVLSFLYTGGFSATCGEFTYACNFNDTDATSGTAYSDNCTLTDNSTGTTATADANAFFSELAGTYNAIAEDMNLANDVTPSVTTHFTDGAGYNIIVSANGSITFESDAGSVTFTYGDGSNESELYELYAHEDYVIMVKDNIRMLMQRHFGDFEGIFVSFSDANGLFPDLEFSWRFVLAE